MTINVAIQKIYNIVSVVNRFYPLPFSPLLYAVFLYTAQIIQTTTTAAYKLSCIKLSLLVQKLERCKTHIIFFRASPEVSATHVAVQTKIQDHTHIHTQNRTQLR